MKVRNNVCYRVFFPNFQSVVSALSEPDTVAVAYRPWKKEEGEIWSIDEVNPGSKKKTVVMSQVFTKKKHKKFHYFYINIKYFLPIQTSSGATTEELESPPSSSSSLCLPRETFLRIARLSVEVERGFGGARDVEFAVKDGEIHLLQVGKTSVKIKRAL